MLGEVEESTTRPLGHGETGSNDGAKNDSENYKRGKTTYCSRLLPYLAGENRNREFVPIRYKSLCFF